MSRQIRISIADDEVFERLKRRKDALDLSWEDALRRGLRDSPKPPHGQHVPNRLHSSPEHASGHHHKHDRGRARGRDDRHSNEKLSPFDPDFGERIAHQVLSSVNDSLSGFADETLDDEIGRLEEAENAELALGDGEGERIPLRVTLYTGPEGLDVEVVAVRSGKDTEAMNRFVDGARARVAERFARGETARLELDESGETYDVRPNLTWARGPDGSPTVTEVVIGEVVFTESE